MVDIGGPNDGDGPSGPCHEERPALSRSSSPPNETEATTTRTRKTAGWFVPPPPEPEQRRLRRKDPSVVPATGYLHVSKALDTICDDVPILRSACPDADAGGWRSILPNPEWGTFPDGKLSHSFELSDWSAYEVLEDVTFGDYPKENGGIVASLGHYYNFAFHTNNTTLGNLACPSTRAVLLVLVLLVRFIKRLLLPRFTALGRRLGGDAHGPGWADENADRVAKFGAQVWRLLFHSAVSVYGICFFLDVPWWEPGGGRHLMENHGFQTRGSAMEWYYLIQAAYNFDALVGLFETSFALAWTIPGLPKKEGAMATAGAERKAVLRTPLFEVQWSPTVREDFTEMILHHVITNYLIFKSSHYKFTRGGAVILFLHDLSDVPVDISKLAHFVKWKTTTIVCFFSMCAVWIATRLYLLPLLIVTGEPICFECLVTNGILDPAGYWYMYPFLLGGLVALVMMHVFWFWIFLKIGWKVVSKGENHDLTEFKKGEKDSKKDR